MMKSHPYSRAFEACMSHVEINKLSIHKRVAIQDVPSQMKAVVCEVCNSFPELENENILWVERSLNMTMMARPDVWSLLFSSRIKYLILVNTQNDNGRLLLNELPLEAQKGIIAHELCHILDYVFKTRWQIIKTGFIYLFPKWKELYEKSTDYLAIKKGFGPQLKAWSQFVLEVAQVSQDYRDVKIKYYLHPKEIDLLDDMINEYENIFDKK